MKTTKEQILLKHIDKQSMDELCENIEKITNDKRVQNIYMCKNNEYDVFN
jgi:hypothetical protein